MKFTFITVCLVGLLGVGGYYAVVSMKDPATYISTTGPRVGDLHKLETEPQSAAVVNPDPEPVPVAPAKPDATENDLKSNIQKLVDAKTVLKKGSRGIAVGYIQEFMNRYFKKTLKVDNDFGPTLETNVKAFQKATGVTQTGQIGPATLGKMVDWLNKNPQ